MQPTGGTTTTTPIGTLKEQKDSRYPTSGDYVTFDYDQLGRLRYKYKKNGGASGRRYFSTTIPTTSTQYDNNGNMLTAGSWSYAYDKENRMVKASENSVDKARFAYNADGKRIKRVDTNGTIHYVGSHYEVNKGNGLDTAEKITKYYHASLGPMRRLIALRKSGTLYYILSDHLGSTTKTIDTNGNDVDLLRYTTYGETRQGGTSSPTDVRYTGQTLDSSTGLYWYASRPYSPYLKLMTQPATIVPKRENLQAFNNVGCGYFWA